MKYKDFKFFKGYCGNILVSPGIYTLGANWSLEMTQDLSSHNDVDPGRELLELISNEIRREIDNMMINEILNRTIQ